MGIDYSTTVGFGVYLEDINAMAEKILERTGDWDSEEYESIDDYLEDNGCFEIIEGEVDNLNLNCDVCGYGNSYSNSDKSVLMMKYTPENILSKPSNDEINEFIDCCRLLGLDIFAEDIKFIDELHIW